MGENLQIYCIKNNLEHLLEQWHPTKNGGLKPTDVSAGCNKKVFWLLPYDDPNTGKHHEFEWDARIVDRVNGAGCPYLTGQAVWPGFNDLASIYPAIAKEWHPTKNGDLKPTNVTARSNKKVYWFLPYDDPNTGKHHEFEWEAGIADRVKRSGCPYLTGRAVWHGFNDLATTHPEIAKEWHPTKNGNLKPTDVSAGCNKKVFWLLPYDDPNTGKHHEFEWEAVIQSRIQGRGCPYLSGKKVWKGFNDLATTHPELAKEWHPTKNGDLTPSNVTAGSRKIVWWYLLYDEPKTGKHLNFEWPASISTRAFGTGCPYLSGKAVWKGFNDLSTTNPNLAAEWHPSKNAGLTPKKVTGGSGKKVWWECPVGHAYKMSIHHRTYNHSNCPICAKENQTSFAEQAVFYYIRKAFPYALNNDRKTLNGKELDISIPSKNIAIEYDGAKWHQNIKQDITKNQICANNKIMLYRLREKGCPEMKDGKYLKTIKVKDSNIKSLESAIMILCHLIGITVNINIERDYTKIQNQYITSIKKNSLAAKYPEIAKEWHPTKNGNLTPEMVNAHTDKKVWWLLPYDDPITGKHFNFEWKATIYHRTKGCMCPYLSNKAVWKGFNDLSTTNPKLAAQWHPTKNGNLKPSDVTAGSQKKVWWLIPYDDPITGEHFVFEHETRIACRINGNNFDYLLERTAWQGLTDLATTHPDISKEWHPTKNGSLKPTDVTAGSHEKVYWLLPYDDPKTGKHFDFEWQAVVQSRVHGKGCPYISGKALWKGFNDLESTYPELVKEWHSTKNGNLKPSDVTAGSIKKVWWILPYDDPKTGKHFDFEWQATINNRTNGSGCPYLLNRKVWKGFNDLTTTRPEIAAEWHPTMNGHLTPSDVTLGSKKEVWWINSKGEAWKEKIYKRTSKTKKINRKT